MTYRVAFSKRFQSDGTESAFDPTAELDVYLPDGVVADKVFVERFEPEAKHNQEVLDEDDAFLGMSAAEVWDYEVLDERAAEFEDAIGNSETVMEFHIIDATPADEGDLSSGSALAEGGSGGSDPGDGPAGQATTPVLPDDETGALEELTVVSADDPNLGLTNYGRVGPDDWAADTGPTRTADRGVASDGEDMDDDESTLAPDRSR